MDEAKKLAEEKNDQVILYCNSITFAFIAFIVYKGECWYNINKKTLFEIFQIMTDPCIISSYSLSQREQLLKNKLYSTQKPLKALEPPSRSTAAGTTKVPQREAMTATVTDKNLNTFINEVQAEFQKSQAATGGMGMAQNMLYHKTKLLESHIGVLEKNQQNITELFKTVIGSGDRQGKNDRMKYEICNENRRLLLEAMGPLHKQIDDVKKLYEENKSATSELYDNLQTIKEIVKTRPGDIDSEIDQKYKTYKRTNTKLTGAINDAYQEIDKVAVPGLSSEALKHEMAKVKEQMLEIQKDSQAIELELQRRYTRALEENEKYKLLLATGMTGLNEKVTKPQLRGEMEEFDYEGFVDTISDITAEIISIERKFKAGAVVYPNVVLNHAKGKAASFYDFSVEPISLKPKATKTPDKPSYLASIKTRTVTAPSLAKESPKVDLSKNIIERVTTLPAPIRKIEEPVVKPKEEPRKPKVKPAEKPTPIRQPAPIKREMPEPPKEQQPANKIELKEYIEEQLRKQIQEAIKPLADKFQVQKPEPRIDIQPAVAQTVVDIVSQPSKVPMRKTQPAPNAQSLKGAVENMLADMLFKDIKGTKVGPKPAVNNLAYENDFEAESIHEEEIGKKEPSLELTNLDKDVSVQVSRFEKEVKEAEIDATTKIVPEEPMKKAEAPVKKAEEPVKKIEEPLKKVEEPKRIIPLEAKEEVKEKPNTFVFIKRKNEVQQLPQTMLSIPPRPAKIPEQVKSEHVKLDAESEILKRRVPINVEPLIAGMLEPPQPTGVDYANPFSLGPNFAGLQIPPPHVVNLEEYDVSSTSGIHESSISSEPSLPARGTDKKPLREISESEPDSISEGEFRARKPLSKPAREYSNVISMTSSPTSMLSIGEVKAQGKKRANIFSVEDFTYSEGENASSNIKDFSDEGQSGVDSLDNAEIMGRIREIRKQQDTLKQSQESFGLRSSLKAEGEHQRQEENKVNIMFSGDDEELEEGEVRFNPFDITKQYFHQ
eukprot:TRINITY_DN816_c0_g1_i4.p1 TRINITY_DN816_c0_g1~~TRINITY_DN816_c0_g1_i4.p1  ORF type:complete len:1001 (+),score=170.97 TRINITY_DN816_c0_g1_i4:664-3666(+)